MKRTIHFLACCTLLAPLAASGQKAGDTSLSNKVFIVRTDYNPTLIDAKKIESIPVIEKIVPKVPVFTYNLQPRQIETQKTVKTLPPVDFNVKNVESYRGNYAKLGYGNLNTLLGELYLHNTQDEKFAYGAHYKHLSANPSNFMDFNQNDVSLFGKSFSQTGEFGSNLGYTRNAVKFYGANDSVREENKNKARVYENWGLNVYYKNTPSAKKAAFRFDFDFYQFNLSGGTGETDVAANVSWAKKINKSLLTLAGGIDYTILKSPSRYSRNFVNINPSYQFKYDNLSVLLGVNSTVFADTLKAKVYINPVVRLEYPVVKDAVTLYGGTEGSYKKQSLKQLINTNPFITVAPLNNQYNNFKLYAGVNARLAASADFNFDISTSNITNLPLFVTRIDSLNSFQVVYDNVRVLKIGAQVNYSLSEKIRLSVAGNFYDYKMKKESNPWQLPNAELKVRGQYKLKEKVYVYLDIIGMGQRYQRFEPHTKPDQVMKGIADFNIGFDYRFKPNFSFFINCNNLSSVKYQRWYNYGSYGFNAIGGLAISL